jgi:hypothetical protein
MIFSISKNFEFFKRLNMLFSKSLRLSYCHSYCIESAFKSLEFIQNLAADLLKSLFSFHFAELILTVFNNSAMILSIPSISNLIMRAGRNFVCFPYCFSWSFSLVWLIMQSTLCFSLLNFLSFVGNDDLFTFPALFILSWSMYS